MPNHDYAPIPRPLNFPWLACFFLALLLLIATTLSRANSTIGQSTKNSRAIGGNPRVK